MNTMDVFFRGEAARAAGNSLMVFDWDKAARRIKEERAWGAAAGLSGDWGYTGGEILLDGKPSPIEDTYVYLASLWATPELEIDGFRENCFINENDVPKEWGNDYPHIYWPPSALKILGEK